MKTPAEVLAALATKVDNCWHLHLEPTDDSTSRDDASATQPFTWTVKLLTAKSNSLAQNPAQLMAWAQDWHTWHRTHAGDQPAGAIRLDTTTRHVGGIPYPGTPERLTITGIDTAAALTGNGRLDRNHAGRRTIERLRAAHPGAPTAGLATAARALSAETPADVHLAAATLAWYAAQPADATSGLHPRQVPIPGVHGKWLESHQRLLAALLDRPLNLTVGYPAQFQYRYLDPTHLAAGGRAHDLAVVGDAAAPAYRPQVVLIVENKHTARNFPPVPAGIIIEGAGTAATGLAALPWVRESPLVVYWGDLDAAGMEILNSVRGAGIRTVSLLTDLDTYRRYRDYGARHDTAGRPLPVPDPKPVPYLTGPEHALYEHLTDPTHDEPRRIEQERIPLPDAAAALARVIEANTPTVPEPRPA